MSQTMSPLPRGDAQTVSTYMLQDLGNSQGGISYWRNGSAGEPPSVDFGIARTSAGYSFTPADVTGLQQAAGLWEWVCSINLAPTTSTPYFITIRPGNQDVSTASYPPGVTPSRGPFASDDIELISSRHDFSMFSSKGFSNAVHELGHAMGLTHSGSYNGTDPSQGTVFQTDSKQYTIMSYNPASMTGSNVVVDGTTYYDSTPMLYDIYAVQRLYGAPTVSAAGNTRFGFNASEGLPAPYDFTKNPRPVLTIYSHTKTNTLDLSGFSTDATVNLHSGAFSSFAGMTNNVTIYYTTSVDTLIAGSGTNTIYANDDPDSITGGTGSNTLFLGRGTDTVESRGHDTIIAGTGDSLIKSSGAATVFGGAGKELTGVNVAAGSLLAVGGPGKLFVNASAGDVTVYAGAGGTTVAGGAGQVTAWGKTSGDLLTGGSAQGNALIGGAAAETLFGSGGGLMVGAAAGGDVLVAGPGNVTLTGAGSQGANTVFGGSGASTMTLGKGNDLVVLGGGASTVFGGSSRANIYGGSGALLAIAGSGGAYVQAGVGQSTVHAGSGADLFRFVDGAGGGTELIVGFKQGVDRISLGGFGPDAATSALATARTAGGDTTIQLADNTRVTFAGLSQLTHDAFA